MPDFVLSRDVAYAVGAYVVLLSGVLLWLFASSQKVLQRSILNAFCIAARLGLVVFALIILSWCAGIATWFVIAAIGSLVVVGLMMDIPFSGIVGLALLYVVQQFVLGFPARHEWMLTSSTGSTVADTSSHRHSELIGAKGVTVSPLRPIGEVRVAGAILRAKTQNGQLLDVGHEIVVATVYHGTLVVRSANEATAVVDGSNQ